MDETYWLPPNDGEHALNYWLGESYTADTNQTITDLDADTHSLSVWVDNSGSVNERYLYIQEADGTRTTEVIPDTIDGWQEVTLTAGDVIKAFPDGTFRPYVEMSRAESA